VSSVQEAVSLIKAFEGAPETFHLAVPDSLFDPAGVNMAIITDHILARGWQPDGFVQRPGYRICKYKELE
jgi:hypothetical protein